MKSLLFFLLILALSLSLQINHQRHHHSDGWYKLPWDLPYLTEEELVDTEWKFYAKGGGVVGILNFAENGTITNIDTFN